MATLEAIFASDRRGDFRAFRETAQLVRREFEEAGLSEIEVIAHPADGIRKHGDWIVPQAWDAFGGELRIVAPNPRLVASHPDEPLALAMWSAPTPEGGVEAEMVLWEDADEDLTGRIVFTSRRVREVADEAMGRGAVGLISDYARTDAVDPTARYWENYCFVPRNESGGFAFILSPAEGEQLRGDVRRARAAGAPLMVKATVDTRLYDGEVDIVTGVMPGAEDAEEVLLVAHLYEIGANDNCSGAALCIEVARALTELIASGELPRPRRGIRVLLCYEQYGTIAYLEKNRERGASIVAGLNADMVGEDQELCGSVLNIDNTPAASPSYTNDLIARLFELQNRTFPEFQWKETRYQVHDGFISDPMIGIATPTLLHQPDCFYHSDADTPDKVSLETLRIVGAAVAAYACMIADAGPDEARMLAELSHARGKDGRVAESVLRLVPGDEREQVAAGIAEWACEADVAGPEPVTPDRKSVV